MNTRKTLDDYRKLAAERGWEYLGGEAPDTVRDKALWCCPNGHLIEIAYYRLRMPERGCRYCSQRWHKDIQDYTIMGRLHGLTLVEMGRNSRVPSRWLNSDGEEVKLSFYQLLTRRVVSEDASEQDSEAIKKRYLKMRLKMRV